METERADWGYQERKLTEHCGLAAIFTNGEVKSPAEAVFLMTRNMMTRGQDGFGMVGVNEEGKMVVYHQLGRNWEIPAKVLEELNKCFLIAAHNRYPTKGSKGVAAGLQPFVIEEEGFFMAHNGEIFNTDDLQSEITRPIISARVNSDSAFFADRILNSSGLSGNREREAGFVNDERVIEGISQARGAFSLIMGTGEGDLYFGRDPWGFRPLAYGKLGKGSLAVASETNALNLLGAGEIKIVEPGDFWKVNRTEGLKPLAHFYSPEGEHFCIFEAVYFSQPPSLYAVGERLVSMARARVEAGKILAKKDRGLGIWEKSVVVPVPESGRYASQGYALEAGLPTLDLLMRTRDAAVGRVFIENDDRSRQEMVSYKHIPIEDLLEQLEGIERLIVIDDTIVRGDTIRYIVSLLRIMRGIKREVHVRAASPPIKGACYLGIDTEDEELIAYQHKGDWRAIAQAIGADSVGYLTVDELLESVTLGGNERLRANFCTSCFTGDYFFPELMERAGFDKKVGLNR